MVVCVYTQVIDVAVVVIVVVVAVARSNATSYSTLVVTVSKSSIQFCEGKDVTHTLFFSRNLATVTTEEPQHNGGVDMYIDIDIDASTRLREIKKGAGRVPICVVCVFGVR